MSFGQMRRANQQVTDLAQIRGILQQAPMLHLGLVDRETGFAYVVPLNYGFSMEGEEIAFYVHTAPVGRKMDLLRQDNRVSVTISRCWGVTCAEVPCDWGVNYDSFMAEAEVSFLEGEEKHRGMDYLMQHYGMNGRGDYRPGEFSAMKILKIKVLRYTAKQYRGADFSAGAYEDVSPKC